MNKQSTDWDEVPLAGQVWCCGACGRLGRGKRSDMGDTSCVMWAVLCHDDETLVIKNGRATAARAVSQ